MPTPPASPREAYDLLRQIRPSSGGRPKRGGYDLVTYNSTAPYMTLIHDEGQGGPFRFFVDASEVSRHDKEVLDFLATHDALCITEA